MLAQRIVERELSVRDIESTIQKMAAQKWPESRKSRKQSGPKAISDPGLLSLLDNIGYRLGTRVSLRGQEQQSGRLEIFYHGREDLDRILNILLG
jgi:ParB-like chromosome segregation protein Spo0J